jgi:hypothetical protein
MSSQRNCNRLRAKHENNAAHVTRNGNKITVSSSLRLTDGTLDLNPETLCQPTVLRPTATRARLKIKASQYFLALLKQTIRNEAAALFHTEALVQSLRSATFILQKLAEKNSEFKVWYEEKRKLMRQNPILRKLVDLRNISEKEGLSFVEFQFSTIVRHYRDGRIEREDGEPVLKFEGKEIADPLMVFEIAIQKISEVIEEAHKKGFIPVPSQKAVPIKVELLREKADGSWEHFDPGT